MTRANNALATNRLLRTHAPDSASHLAEQSGALFRWSAPARQLPSRARHVFRGVLLGAMFLTPPSYATDRHGVAPADLVFRGGTILTLDASSPLAQAVAVRAGRIVYVGDNAGSSAYIGERTKLVDLGARMLMPAFIDAHIHPMSGGLRLLRCNLEDNPSPEAALRALIACAHKPSLSPWLIVNGLSEKLAGDARFDRRALDRIAPDKPLAITIGAGFSLRVNSAALARAGLAKKTADSARTGVERDRTTGEPTGLVSGKAETAVRKSWPRPTSAEYREALRKATALANRFGIVSVFDASTDMAMLDAYHAADLANELTVRVVAAQHVSLASGLTQINAMRTMRDRVRSYHVRADAAKIFLDGEIELHTAALLQPYHDAPGDRGAPIDEPSLVKLVTELDRKGFDLHMHAMGDRAVRSGLDAIERAIAANGPRDRRDQLAHDEIIDPADLPRFAALDISANVQPTWAWHSPVNRDAEQKLGLARAQMLVPLRSLFDAHARVVASSDGPAPSINPFEGIQIAMTRRPLDGSAPAWHPRQAVTLMQMLQAYCSNAAWVMRLDKVSGSIAVGKSADLIVLDRDLRTVDPMALHTVRVLLTLFEGKVVYRDPALAP